MHVTESLWADIGKQIATAVGNPFKVKRQRSVGGGCINDAYVVEGEGSIYFVKLNQADTAFMFEAEAAGLAEIAGTGTLRVPQPVCTGSIGSVAFLVLEYIQLKEANNVSQCELGRRLAAMHRFEHAQYGWHQNNNIGTTPQQNTWKDDWVTFWRDNRLGVQLDLAEHNGVSGTLLRKGEQLRSELGVFFSNRQPKPALLHGDLWSGNWATDQHGHPVVFDPAVYYGDRETDLAMTELFGGFDDGFYAAYQETYPLEEGYAIRKKLYNLYHILNHFNLFGSGYAVQAERMMDLLLREIQ